MAKRNPQPPKSADEYEPKAPISTVETSRCEKCGSTERTPYRSTKERQIHGRDHVTGLPYTHVVWRRTQCLNCKQMRVDRTFENRVTEEEADE